MHSIAIEAINDCQNKDKKKAEDDTKKYLRANTLDMPTNIIDDFSGDGSSKKIKELF